METTLHRQLKELYANENSQQEVQMDKYRIDVVRDDVLVEIQLGSLAAIRDKIQTLLKNHRVLLVKPIVDRKHLIKLKSRGGEILSRRRSPKRANIMSLFDELGWGRHVTDRMQPGARFLTMITSRGCPFKCTFCSNKHFWGQRIKYRSIEQVVDEMEILKFKYGADIIGFNDDNFFTHKRRCEKVFDEINRRKLKLKWFAQGGTLVQSLADEGFLEKALESGLCFLNLAIESSSEKTLRLIKKPLKLANANQLVNHVKKKYPELYMNSGFIIGFPFETKADIINTFEYSKKLELDWAVYNNFRPMPGTELYDTCVEEGIIEKFTFNNYDDTSRPYSEESHFDGPDWTKEWLMDTMYKYNLDVNFINSYNMRIGNYQQALNDFEYVARSFKGQAIAHRQASLCASKLGLSDKAKYHAFEEQKIMSKPGKFHGYYEQFSIKPIHNATRVA